MKVFLKLLIVTVCCGTVLLNCKKGGGGNNNNNNNNNGNISYDSTYNPADAAVVSTQGFFLDDWAAKAFTVPAYTLTTPITGPATDTVKLDADIVLTKVSKYLFGANANLWMGQVVTQSSLMQYITDLSPNVIRGPGGSTSDIYFWNASSKPSDVPDSLLDASSTAALGGYWYGQNTASWTMSIDNYYSLLSQTNSVGIQTVNYGYARYGTSANPVAAAAHLAADWVRYDKGRTKFWEIGNENFGNWEAGYNIDVTKNKDGQPKTITGTLYGQDFLIYADSMRNAAQSIGVTIKIGAQLLDAAVTYSNQLSNWNATVLATIGNNADFFIVHDYYTAYETNAAATEILGDAISVTAAAKNYIASAVQSAGVTAKPIAMTEFNITSQGSQQQISFINGMTGVLTVGELIKNQFGQASRWDLANAYSTGNDMGMFANSAGSDVGTGETNWNPRPAFYTMYYFQKFLGDRLISSTSSTSDIVAYSSTFASSNSIATVLVNKGTTDRVVAVNINHFPMGSKYYWYTLKGGTDNGEFSPKVYVNGNTTTGTIGGPLNYATISANAATRSGNVINVTVPARSIIYLAVDKK